MTDQLLEIARVTKPHGVRGEVVLHMYAESSDLLRGEVLMASSATSTTQTVRRIVKTRRHHETMLVTFEGITDRTAAELLRNHVVLVPRSQLPELDEGEFYLADMLGLQVIAEEEGKAPFALGVLTHIVAPAGQELWSIVTPAGEEILLPAVPEFIQDIDLERGEAHIAPPPGLLELYMSKG